jgi:hypothetical protein
MAYMNQERKAKLAPAIKALFKRYGIKASIAVRHNSTLVVNIKSGAIDLIGNYIENLKTRNYNKFDPNNIEAIKRIKEAGNIDVNPYWYHEHFTGEAQKFLSGLFLAMNTGNHDRSDIQADYFDVGWYVDVNIGKWNKPYEVV